MVIGLKEGQRMADRARRWTALKRLGLLVAGAALALFAYETGTTRTEYRVERLERRLATQDADLVRLETEKAALDSQRLAAAQRRAELQARYDRDVPTGETRALYALLEDRLQAGLSVERIAFLLKQSAPEPACDPEPVSKRLILPTLLYDGANTLVQFAGGRVTVTGRGEAALSARGLPEAWFDPARPVTLRFTAIGGETVEVAGKLPLDHAMVLGGDEYRFNARAGERSFVIVTALRCDFPSAPPSLSTRTE